MKKIFWFRFFVGDVISGVGFWAFWLRLPGPGNNCYVNGS